MKSFDSLNRNKAAAIIIDLQKGYCDPTSDAATKLESDAVCKAHLSYLEKLRAILSPEKIIWSQMEEAPETYAWKNI